MTATLQPRPPPFPVYQGAVETYHWLMPTQMIEGLAFGETTPGPLIMIVVFGGDALLLAGMLVACIATFFTFLPSFLFILAGGPGVESTRGNIRLTAPLTAISAAVVGAIGITAAAVLALFRFRTGTITLIGACALAGLVVSYLR